MGEPPKRESLPVDERQPRRLRRDRPCSGVCLRFLIEDEPLDDLPIFAARLGVLAHDAEHDVTQVEAYGFRVDQGADSPRIGEPIEPALVCQYLSNEGARGKVLSEA